MQIIPFVFSLIVVFIFLISQSSYDQRIDRVLMRAMSDKAKARLELCKKGERASFIKERKLTKQAGHENQGSKKLYQPRPIKAVYASNKFSLCFFEKKQNELATLFAKRELKKALSIIYGEEFSEDFFHDLVQSFLTQKPKQICKLKLSSKENQELFFRFLTDPSTPLDQILCTDEFENKGLFYFGSLSKVAFHALFDQETLEEFFDEEKKIKTKIKTKSLPKESTIGFFLKQKASWEIPYIDYLVCFQIPKQKTLKAYSDLASEFFYFVTD